MTFKKQLLALVFLVGISAGGRCCSCEALFFCEHFASGSAKVVFQARVLHLVDYGANYHAAYLQILKKYRDDFQITDTIKLYGKNAQVDCNLQLFDFYHPGDTILMSLDTMFGIYPILNPDSLLEDFSAFHPWSCQTVTLRLSGGKVRGRITENIYEYPFASFEQGVGECDFPPEEIPEPTCLGDDLVIFPNPSLGGKFFISGAPPYGYIEKVRVFAVDGRLLTEQSQLFGEPGKPIEISVGSSGVHIFEIQCNGQKYSRRAIAVN